MNVLTIAGNIGSVQELRSVSTASGQQSVLGFSVAVRTNKKGNDGKYLSQWFDCAIWGKRAESLVQYLAKGSKVTVTGEVELEQYQSKDGTPGAKMKVNVRDVALQGDAGQQSAPAQQPRQQAPAQQSAQANQQQQNQGSQFIDYDDDIPFAPIGLSCKRMLHCI